ncbi:hypothetical protein [Roseisolibacter sp. H3M3-2]|uniref:hypothetical protein n=1 Tax=Roseisolibacter sp. H3M3-2 TaxID=3031323 RepID=UPI0023DA4A36|nr:hypothetical protein [Roseisolibacter sp. H3M3-2]MDF1504910.1 hypothetical protein [Roseisolibacter sp. H3M3-2]
MTAPGIGDRWLRGEAIDGVAFAQHDAVAIAGGSRDGQAGRVLLLLAVAPRPLYLVALDAGGDLKVHQGALRPLRPRPS